MNSSNPSIDLSKRKGPNQSLPAVSTGLPPIVWPTLLLFLAAVAVSVWSVTSALTLDLSAWVAIPVNVAVIFVMFTILHDASHHSAGSSDLTNEVLGRLSGLYVFPYASFALFRFIHIEHHRNTNEGMGIDPDAWTSAGPEWQHPLRWLTIDLWYAWFYLRNAPHRPAAEVVEAFSMVGLFIVGLIWAAAAGQLWTVVVLYLIPQRIAVGVLAWWFDWLPHHGLSDTARQNRFRATRNRVGMEWLFTPMMLSQNYHLVHHLYPVIPWYRYVRTWRDHEEAFLSRDPAISDMWGTPFDAVRYRAWRGLPPPAAPQPSSAPSAGARATFHPLRVARVERLTPESVGVTFDIPRPLRETFKFQQGQHITVRCDLGGEGIRRNYSICSSAVSGPLRIGVRHVPGGAFSTYAMEQLKVGDMLDVMPPSGRFFTQLDARQSRFYVAISAGSGITPILSILSTTLEVEMESKFILLFGNRRRESIMFLDELQAIKHRYPERFQVLHFLSDPDTSGAELNGSLEREEFYGRLDREMFAGNLDQPRLSKLLSTFIPPKEVNEWFLCGPQGMVEVSRQTLLDHGVANAHIHHELFIAAPTRKPGGAEAPAGDAVISRVSLRAGGKETAFDLAQGGETVLDAGMRLRKDLPYSCLGGACGTCRAKLCEGTVDMEQNYALDADELAAGYVLTCQSRPTSPVVTLDYDG